LGLHTKEYAQQCASFAVALAHLNAQYSDDNF